MTITGERGKEIKTVEVNVVEHIRDNTYIVRYNGKISILTIGGELGRMNGAKYITLLKWTEVAR